VFGGVQFLLALLFAIAVASPPENPSVGMKGAPPVRDATAGEPASESAPTLEKPDWVRRPGPDGSIIYPAKASKAEVSGRTVMVCRAMASGLLEGCWIKSEEPAGYDFGKAMLAVAPQFRLRPTLPDGTSVKGYTVRVTMNWGLP
jgi:hypothetical protein